LTKNYLTIDLEDWYQVNYIQNSISSISWSTQKSYIEPMVNEILDLLDLYGIKATFFVVGWLAESFPDTITKIHLKGHELACHTFWHKEINNYNEEEFKRDLIRAKKAIEKCSGKKVKGFRAPNYSIFKNKNTFYSLLSSLGFEYDSSMCAFTSNPYKVNHASNIIEVPANGFVFFKKQFPINGGFVFRFIPYGLYKLYFKAMNSFGCSINFYIHSWELYTGYPRLNLGFKDSFIQYYNLNRTPKKFNKLLKDFRFEKIESIVTGIKK